VRPYQDNDAVNPQGEEMTALLRDKKGSGIITYTLVLPIFIFLIFGVFEVWKIISIKQALDAGTYKAARYLSANYDQEGAREIVWNEVEKNSVLGEDASKQVKVYIPTRRPDCSALFTVRAELSWAIVIPYLPSRDDMWLVEQHTSYIECTDYDIPLEIRLQN